MSGADSTKPLSDQRTRKSRQQMSGRASGHCSSRSSMDLSMHHAVAVEVDPNVSDLQRLRCRGGCRLGW